MGSHSAGGGRDALRALLVHQEFESPTAGITDRRIPEEHDQRRVRYQRGAKDDGIRGKKAVTRAEDRTRRPTAAAVREARANRKTNKKKRKKVPRASGGTGFSLRHAPFTASGRSARRRRRKKQEACRMRRGEDRVAPYRVRREKTMHLRRRRTLDDKSPW